jgi:hypothetical protein
MSKSPDTTGVKISQRIRDALDLIKPTGDREAACIRCLKGAYTLVKNAKGPRIITHKQSHDALRARREALRALETALAAYDFLWPEEWPSREDIREHRERVEEFAKIAPYRPRKSGGRRPSPRRQAAVRNARKLLKLFGSSPPTQTHGGAWHLLSLNLYGDPNADLFQSLRDYRDPEQELELGYDGKWRPAFQLDDPTYERWLSRLGDETS